jgi:hypothetical protein
MVNDIKFTFCPHDMVIYKNIPVHIFGQARCLDGLIIAAMMEAANGC